jgi:hypothetical protein
MPHARKKNVHAKPLKLLKPRAAPINTCVENDDWPRAKPGGRKRCFISHEGTKNIDTNLLDADCAPLERRKARF